MRIQEIPRKVYAGLLVVLLMFAVSCDGIVDNQQQSDPSIDSIVSLGKQNGGLLALGEETITLFAGQNIPVGTVNVSNDGDNLFVEYLLDADAIVKGWCITETHAHVGGSLKDFPLRGRWNNPAPGQFDYKGKHHPCVTDFSYEIPIDTDWGDDILIATHAVVKRICPEPLPDVVSFNISNWANARSAWDILVDGTEPTRAGWCGDVATRIPYAGDRVGSDGNYDNAFVYESISLPSDAPSCVAVLPWGSINWILNNWKDLGYSSGDAQVAMWGLIHNYDFSVFPRERFQGIEWTQANVDELEKMARKNADFKPGYDDFYAIILLVDNKCPDYNFPFDVPDPLEIINRHPIKQMVYIDWPKCKGQKETAWGAHDVGLIRFSPGRQGNWATYFEYTLD